MAASETSIANAALILLGERRINSIDDTNKSAKLIKDRFDDIRDNLLRLHPWNFATKRASITADPTAPAWGFDFAYGLPTDCLRLLEVDNDAGYQYRVEGRQVITDIPAPLKIEYTKKVTDVSQMDVTFLQALSASIASDLAEAITGSTEKMSQMFAVKQEALRAARVPDGQEPSPRQLEASEWLDSREVSGFARRIPSDIGTPL